MNATWGGVYETLEEARVYARSLAVKYGPINIVRRGCEFPAKFYVERGSYTFATPAAMSRVGGALVELVSPEPSDLPAFRVFLENGTDYVTSMAKGVTLEYAKKYFLGQRLTQADEKTTLKVVKVEEV